MSDVVNTALTVIQFLMTLSICAFVLIFHLQLIAVVNNLALFGSHWLWLSSLNWPCTCLIATCLFESSFSTAFMHILLMIYWEVVLFSNSY